MDYMKSRLSPQWKLSPENKFSCSEAKKLTAMEIMDLVDEGILTDGQAEVEFKKLEEMDTDADNTNGTSFNNGKMIDNQSEAELEGLEKKKPKDKTLDTATAKKAKEVLNELIKCKAIELIQDEAFTSEHKAPNNTRHM